MTYGAFTPRDFQIDVPRAGSRSAVPQAVLCAIGLVTCASIGLWMLYAEPPASPVAVQASLPQPSSPPRAVPPSSPRVASRPGRGPTWFDPSLTTTKQAGTFDQALPLGADFQQLRAPAVVEAPTPSTNVEHDTAESEPAGVPLPVIVAEIAREIPLPLPRPAFAPTKPRDVVQRPRPMTLLTPEADGASFGAITNPGKFFQRVFGDTPPRGPALAYAAPEDDGLGPALLGRAAPDRWTAVYNIATHTVTLPSGAQLEAHSGLGPRMDDPRSVTEHMRGATPPNTYDLTLREAPFHGVRALRLTPIGGTTYGRAGLLAHTFMLGPRGDSNGCVVFRNYAAFLRAYETGAIRRLVVVTGAS